jgi:UDP-N-acetylglucosamine--N-acetylmuramyl-(pentapeptide) pyrophosphoryl-undecaprenol N-acetylglucosamine transferase
VISRAGAASLSELSQFGLPSILVPYPYATDDHQTHNAKVFVDAGAAELQPEQKITPDALAVLIGNLLTNDRRREQMAAAARSALPKDAAGNVATVIEQTVASRS